MIYVLAIFLGFIFAVALIYLFDLLVGFSPLLDYLGSNPNLNAESIDWYILLIHDSAIFLLVAAIFIFIYRKFLSEKHLNWITVILMQLPTTYSIFSINGLPNEFSNSYEISTRVSSIVGASCIVLVYAVIIAYNKALSSSD